MLSGDACTIEEQDKTYDQLNIISDISHLRVASASSQINATITFKTRNPLLIYALNGLRQGGWSYGGPIILKTEYYNIEVRGINVRAITGIDLERIGCQPTTNADIILTGQIHRMEYVIQ